MKRALPFLIAVAAAVIIAVPLFYFVFLNPPSKPNLRTYDPETINGNLTDDEISEKAREQPIIALFVENYPNAKLDIRHSNEMLHNPPYTSVLFQEERKVESDPTDTLRSFIASVSFPIDNNSTGLVDVDCTRVGLYSAENVAFIPVDNATDFILNEKCFSPILP